MNHELNHLSQLVRQVAAEEILARFTEARVSTKSDGSLVTETDVAVQRRLGEALARDFPGVVLLGEEMSAEEQAACLDAPEFWALDPLDGTSNYARGFPGFAVSLALIRQGRVELGLVLDPLRDECFSAARGAGAWLNGAPIRPFAPSESLGDCLAMIDLKRLPAETRAALFAPGGFRSQRNLGAVALEWCWLASGRVQLYLHGSQRIWDYAAGRLIATEAGAPSHLYHKAQGREDNRFGLDARLAIAAASEPLLEHWRDFLAPALPFVRDA